MTVGRLLREVDGNELAEWQAFDKAYGLPDIYFATAQIARAAVAPWSKEAPKAEDWVPYFARASRKQTSRDHAAIIRALAGAARKDRV